MLKFVRRAAFGAFLLIFIMPPAHALDADAAKDFVQRLMRDAVAELAGRDLNREARSQVLVGLLERYANTRETSGDLLGRFRATTPDDDQVRFEKSFVAYLLATWTDYLADLSPGLTLTVSRVDVLGDRLLVQTLCNTPGEEPIPVEWTLGGGPDGRPYVADVGMGGVNVVRMMRADFTSVLFASGGKVDALIAALQKKTDLAAANRSAQNGR
jgi:ABC-type transporter MlaC component